MHDEKTLKWFERHGVNPPTHISHEMTPDDIKDRLRPLKPHSWRLEGNRLIAKTEMGELVNLIPTDYILVGEDENGLPKFKRIVT